jgi:uncharacterized protein with FMN-binding domain
MKTSTLRNAIFAILTVVISLALCTACPGDDVKNISIDGINLAGAKDGTWVGICETSLIKVTVNVTIDAARITEIKVTRHVCGKGKPAETITNAVLEKQTTKVDTISGATGSSIVILKAIENAVAKASE